MRLALQITVMVLVSMAGLILAAAETEDLSGSWMSVLTVPIALATWLLIDHLKVVRIPLFFITLGGLFAFYLAAQEFTSDYVESKLLSASHLLVYLTWVYLLQEKTSRQYWWLHALAALQLALASVLTAKPWLGVALITTAFLGGWSLSLFLVTRSVEAALNPDDWEKHEAGARGKSRVGQMRSGLSYDQGHRLINWRFLLNSLIITVLGLVFSVFFFVFIPRVWIGPAALGGEGGGGRTIGFSETVRLGEMGKALENAEPAMEIRIFDRVENRYLNESETSDYLGVDPLFRGAVLEIYEDGRWIRGTHESMEIPDFKTIQEYGANVDVIRYREDIRLLSVGSPLLLSNGRIATMESQDVSGIRQRYRTEEFFHEQNFRLTPIQYRTYQIPEEIYLQLQAGGQRNVRRSEFEYYEELRKTPDNLSRTADLVDEVLGDSNSVQEAVDRLHDYFTQDNRFEYSLDLSVDDRTIDPVEDFLFNRKSGHCEYYASATALMLRQWGIPTRVVTGYKGGAWDSKRSAFVVQELHAHAWTEVLDLAPRPGRDPVRIWRVVDNTPDGRMASVREREGDAPAHQGWGSTFNNLWSVSVQMTKNQQQESIYQPLYQLTNAVGESVQNPVQFLRESTSGLQTPQGDFNWAAGVLTMLVLLFIAGVAWTVRLLWNRLRSVLPVGAAAGNRSGVEFFERFQSILKRRGLVRIPTQTQLEFSRMVAEQFAPQLRSHQLEEWPPELACRFYEVRFGEQVVSPEELTRMSQRLDDLERCVQAMNRSKANQ